MFIHIIANDRIFFFFKNKQDIKKLTIPMKIHVWKQSPQREKWEWLLLFTIKEIFWLTLMLHLLQVLKIFLPKILLLCFKVLDSNHWSKMGWMKRREESTEGRREREKTKEWKRKKKGRKGGVVFSLYI